LSLISNRVELVLYTGTDCEVYARANLKPVATYKPLAKGNEPYQWVNETKIAPWTIYVLAVANPFAERPD